MDIVSALAKISEITTSPNREIDPQELTEIVPKFFEKITEIKLRTCFNCGHHSISKLEKGEQGVYIFLVGDKHYLKVGKVGCNSDARWNSHHYTLNRTASALPGMAGIPAAHAFRGVESGQHDDLPHRRLTDGLRAHVLVVLQRRVDDPALPARREIGRASCRERV